MSGWKNKIVDAFISHYFAAASESAVLRIRSAVFFPGFDAAHADEKESYLEAAESLERKGLVKLRWEKRGEGERLKTLSCENFEMLFEEAGRAFPKTEAAHIKTLLGAKVEELRNSPETEPETENIIAFLEHLSLHFGPREIGQGLNRSTMEDLIRLLEFMLHPAGLEYITTRSLSILLYRDSKRLEELLSLCAPLFSGMWKTVPLPDFARFERSYPETMLSGRVVIEFGNSKTPVINSGGHILGFPLRSAEEISSIQPVSSGQETNAPAKSVLTIENKETFYALGTPQKHSAGYDCFLYVGGFSNRAAAALIKILAASGFAFYHAGDLDPDGILILQHIQELAGKPVIPVRMDAGTFDQYRAWGRTLTKPMLRQTEKIREETKTIPGIADLLRRIEETGLGVEQEIIDYR